jgi:tetratricopeptide (TPR) repeat protein
MNDECRMTNGKGRTRPLSSLDIRHWVAGGFLLLALIGSGCSKSGDADQFTRFTNLGKSQLEQGNGAKAVEFFQQALKLNASTIEPHLNLANAHLLSGESAAAIREAGEALRLDANSAAAHYIAGCAWLRAGDATNALMSLQQSHKIDPAITALNFQLGLAHERLGQTEDAIRQFQTVIDFEPEHPAVFYRLSQLLLRSRNTRTFSQRSPARPATSPCSRSASTLSRSCRSNSNSRSPTA